MKITVIVPELGERVPKKGDWYVPMTWWETEGMYVKAHADFELPRQCATVHEIDVPEGAKDLVTFFSGEHRGSTVKNIPIPQPPKKVKRHIEGWARLHPSEALGYVYANRSDCERSNTGTGPVVFVQGDYEIEE